MGLFSARETRVPLIFESHDGPASFVSGAATFLPKIQPCKKQWHQISIMKRTNYFTEMSSEFFFFISVCLGLHYFIFKIFIKNSFSQMKLRPNFVCCSICLNFGPENKFWSIVSVEFGVGKKMSGPNSLGSRTTPLVTIIEEPITRLFYGFYYWKERSTCCVIWNMIDVIDV